MGTGKDKLAMGRILHIEGKEAFILHGGVAWRLTIYEVQTLRWAQLHRSSIWKAPDLPT